jgi:hypothetical protein
MRFVPERIQRTCIRGRPLTRTAFFKSSTLRLLHRKVCCGTSENCVVHIGVGTHTVDSRRVLPAQAERGFSTLLLLERKLSKPGRVGTAHPLAAKIRGHRRPFLASKKGTDLFLVKGYGGRHPRWGDRHPNAKPPEHRVRTLGPVEITAQSLQQSCLQVILGRLEKKVLGPPDRLTLLAQQ